MPNLAKIIAKIDAYKAILATIDATYKEDIDYEALNELIGTVADAQEKADKEYSDLSAGEEASNVETSDDIAAREIELNYFETRLLKTRSFITEKLQALEGLPALPRSSPLAEWKSLPPLKVPSRSASPESEPLDITLIALIQKKQEIIATLFELLSTIDAIHTELSDTTKSTSPSPLITQKLAVAISQAIAKQQAADMEYSALIKLSLSSTLEKNALEELNEQRDNLRTLINSAQETLDVYTSSSVGVTAGAPSSDEDYAADLDSPTSLPSPITPFAPRLAAIQESESDLDSESKDGASETTLTLQAPDVVVDTPFDRLGNKRKLVRSPIALEGDNCAGSSSTPKGELLQPSTATIASGAASPLSSDSAASSENEACSDEEASYSSSRKLLAYILEGQEDQETVVNNPTLKTLKAARAVLKQVDILKKQGEPTNLLTEVLRATHTLLHTEGSSTPEYVSLAKNRVQGHGSPAMMFLGKLMLALTAIFAAVVLWAPAAIAGTVASVAGIASIGFFAKGLDTGLARRMNTLANTMETSEPQGTPVEEGYPLTATHTV